MRLIAQEQSSTEPGRVNLILSVDERCFMFGSTQGNSMAVSESRNCPAIAKLRHAGVSGGTIVVRGSTASQFLSGSNQLRTFRSEDGGELNTIRLEGAAGRPGTVMAAVGFGDGWLVEWRSGPAHWLVLHSATGKPISAAMAVPVDGELFDSQVSDGLHFLRWENGKPVEFVIVPAFVEWSRARD